MEGIGADDGLKYEKGDTVPGGRRLRRQASQQSAFFAMATTSKFFKDQKFKPTKIMGVLFLSDPKPSVAKIREYVVDKLLEFPRFSSFVSLENENGGGERHVMFNFIPKEDIDLSYHFRIRDGKGTFCEEQDLSELVSEAGLMDWDPDKPLWQLTLVSNMKDGRSLLFCVVDHTIGDGGSMSAILASLFDKPEIGNSLPVAKKSKQNTGPEKRFSHRIANLMYAYWIGNIGFAFIPTDPDNCFKFPISKRRVEPKGRNCSQTKHFPLDEVKAIKNRLPGVTINDLVMAIATIAIRRYFEKVHDNMLRQGRLKKITLNVAVGSRPPTTTTEDLINEGGSNRFVVGSFQVPLNFASPIDAIWRCKSQMDIYKTTPLVRITWNTQSFLTKHLPWSLLEQAASDVFFKPTGVLSNVKGPSDQASIGGYIIDDFSFYGVASGQGTYVGISSYNNQVRMFICMDKEIEADPHEFRNCLEAAYEDVRVAVLESASPSELLPPDTTPISARILELLFLALVAQLLGWQIVAFALAVYISDDG